MASKERLTGAAEPSEASPPTEYWALRGSKKEDSGQPLASKDAMQESASERADQTRFTTQDTLADEEKAEGQRTPQREREEAEEPAGRGPQDIGTCGVSQREWSQTTEEAPEPQNPQTQVRRDRQEDMQRPREWGRKGPQSYPTEEECTSDQAEEGSLYGQTWSQRQRRQSPRDRQRS